MADESGDPQQQSGAAQQSGAPLGEQQARDEQVVRKQRRAVFRVPAASLLTVPILLFGVTPIAFSAPGLQLLYLIPVAVVLWVVRVRTTATAEGLTVRTLTSSRSMRWDELSGLSITEKAAIRAVLTDGTPVPLPYVRLHHVPVLSLLSDGRIPDPSGALTSEAASADENSTNDAGADDTGRAVTAGDDTAGRPAATS
ncbi:PH domain-containing protein [Prauserella flava]|uniref:PH domain-containing protein n=1 Tax=Prauserella flava TaxID=577679 RepID=UPI0021646D33|nr:PH domain-containing protein [Prauserella flava]MCR3719416.1 PH domain-containing protein [Prauserella flava]